MSEILNVVGGAAIFSPVSWVCCAAAMADFLHDSRSSQEEVQEAQKQDILTATQSKLVSG